MVEMVMSFRIWPEATKPLEYIGNWEIVFGTFTLDNSANVDMVFLGGMSDFYTPSSCTLNVYVSNDNGATFESYDKATVESHVFGATGTQLRVKLVATGHPNKAPFFTGKSGLTVDYGSLHAAAKALQH